MTTELCSLCGEPAKGYARINEHRLCHEGPSPTCYEKATANMPPLKKVSGGLHWGVPDTSAAPTNLGEPSSSLDSEGDA